MASTDKGIKYATITAAQIRAARGLIDWSRETLSEKSGVSMRTLARIEGENFESTLETFDQLRTTLERAGIKFIKINGGGPGVRLRKRTKH